MLIPDRPIRYLKIPFYPTKAICIKPFVPPVKLWILFITLHLAVDAQSQNVPEAKSHQYSLEQCVDYALQNQHDVKNARLSLQSAAEVVKENKGKLLPHANINGSYQDNLRLPTSLMPDFASGNLNNKIPVRLGSKYTSSLTGVVNQTVFNSNYFLGLKAAKVFTNLSEKNVSITEISTRVNVTKAYYNVLVNREGLRLSKSNVDQIAKSLKDIKAKYEAGISETVDVNRIQTQFNTAVTGVANQERLVDLSLQQLKFQMGMPQTDSLDLTQTIADFSMSRTGSADTTGYAVTDRPEYGLQQTQIALNELSFKSTRLSNLPSVSAFINYGLNYFAPNFGGLYSRGYGNSALGLSLTFPLFSGTERIHQMNQAKITLDQSRNDLDHLSQQIQIEVREAYTDFVNSKAVLETQKTNMGLTQGVYDRITYKFAQGVASSLDLLSAENELQQAQSSYIDALLSTLISKVELEQAMGKLGRKQ